MIATIASLGALAASASAATIEVTTTADEFGSTMLSCSLREAVQTANTNAPEDGCVREGAPGPKDKILLDGGVTYTRSRAGVDDTNALGDLDILEATVIKAQGDGQATIDANDFDRVIHVRPEASLKATNIGFVDGLTATPQTWNIGGGVFAEDAKVTLDSALIQDNTTPDNSGCACGGGIGLLGGKMTVRRSMIEGNSAPINLGGGIAAVIGDFRLDQSTVLGNQASRGGGIYFSSNEDDVAKITRSTIIQNEVLTGDSLANGGGIYVGAERIIQVTNSTISGNRVNASGGGLYVSSGGAKLNAVTVTENRADDNANGTGDGGGLGGDNVTFKNSIVAANTDMEAGNEDCDDTDGVGPSLVGQGTGCEGEKLITAADPGLKPLADNGGATETYALKASSKAVGRAAASAPPKDQRAVKRDSKPDLGAYERR